MRSGLEDQARGEHASWCKNINSFHDLNQWRRVCKRVRLTLSWAGRCACFDSIAKRGTRYALSRDSDESANNVLFPATISYLQIIIIKRLRVDLSIFYKCQPTSVASFLRSEFSVSGVATEMHSL